MRYWFSLLLLIVAYPLVAQETTPSPYRFAYVNDNDTNFRHHFIYTIDPTNPRSPPQQLPLPDGVYVCSDPSPDGKWLPVCYQDPNAGSFVYRQDLMLMELSTGLIHQVAPYGPYSYDLTELVVPHWSPDSRYLAWNIASWPSQNQRGLTQIELYDVQTRQLTSLLSDTDVSLTDGDQFQPLSVRGWSPDSTQLVIAQRTCFIDTGGTNRCYELTLKVYHFPSMTLHKSIQMPFYDEADFCGYYPDWSPDNRYLSFILGCIPMSVGLPFNEVFVWDTETGDLSQLTAYTNTPPGTWTEYPPDRYARYGLLWQDADTLLVGANAREIIMGVGLDLDSIVMQTSAHHLPGGESVLLADGVMNDGWSMNPVSGVIASRVYSYIPNENNNPLPNGDSVEFSIFDGQQLQSIAKAPGGCENLYWSPDGLYLAYAVAFAQYDVGCLTPDRIYLVDQAGVALSVSLSGGSYPNLLGWVIAPDSSVIEPSFSAGTPTPVPTFGAVG